MNDPIDPLGGPVTIVVGVVGAHACPHCGQDLRLSPNARSDLYHLALGARKELPPNSTTRQFAERILAELRGARGG